jgi:hypothetical protein
MSPQEVEVAPSSLQPTALEPPVASEANTLEKGDAEPLEPLERDESQMPHGIRLFAIMAALLIAEVLVGGKSSSLYVPPAPLTIVCLCSGPNGGSNGYGDCS